MTMRCHYAWLLLLLCQATARADGGVVRFSERRGNYHVTIFTSPNPLRAGPVDVSVLIQDASTGHALAPLEIRLESRSDEKWIPPQELSRAASTNKLFHSTKFDLPAAGEWPLRLRIAGDAGDVAIDFDVTAAPRPPRWIDFLPWIALPIIPMLLFLTYQNKSGGRRNVRSLPTG